MRERDSILLQATMAFVENGDMLLRIERRERSKYRCQLLECIGAGRVRRRQALLALVIDQPLYTHFVHAHR